eukprot:CAMPEP_0179192802 /NCGR_PEP_ID=MMETSP0796-20121207/95802_1 /TAXON_ID=73915 /ORGANISM="Pyrodinium bahamense, Strain pbaha01" /LENGTH=309 /DNA_ID=CAMNT_0020897093 /DNA_START=5 /DNA_END=934 /DNA_ORIENTATION=-
MSRGVGGWKLEVVDLGSCEQQYINTASGEVRDSPPDVYPVYDFTPHRFMPLKGDAESGEHEPCICCGGSGRDTALGVCPLCEGEGAFRGPGPGRAPIERVDLLDGGDDDSAFLLRNLLTPAECDDIIAQAEAFGLRDCGASRRVRVTDRVSAMGEDLGRLLFARARPHLTDIIMPAYGQPPRGVPAMMEGLWAPQGLNPCFRVCRYSRGGFFLPHFDGGFDISDTFRSIKTFMLYLNDDFEGGPTNFYSAGQPHYRQPMLKNVIHSLRPEKGSCLVFNHQITHDGGELISGAKYILRTEVMYNHFSLPE